MAYAQTQKIVSPGPSVAGNFGSAVAIDNFYAVVGEASPGDTHLYKRNIDGGWELQKTFAIAGVSVSIYNAYIVVGNGVDNVKVYHRDTHVELKDITGGDGFGSSVAVNRDYILVGAPNRSSNRGAVYVYERDGVNSWAAYSANPITPDILTSGDYFGCSVALDGASIIVGAYGDNQKTGAAYVFDKDSDTELWEQSQKLIASDGAYNDEFGASISASNGYLVSGAKLKESSSDDVNAGAVYIYKYSTTWYEIDKLEGAGESSYTGNRFGESVNINEDYIIVGSPRARNIGVADVFYKKRGWGPLKKILGSDSATGDNFGQSVAISERFIVVGSISEDTGASNAGAAYFYEDPPVRMRLAQEFDVNGDFLPSKATVYLKRIGQNTNSYWELYNTRKTVIDATNFSTIGVANNIAIFSDELSGFTGNGYMILMDNIHLDFPVINYPIRAVTPDAFNLWIRCLSSSSSIFQADILLDGEIVKGLTEKISNPSILEWSWISSKIVLPDTRQHILGIRMRDNGIAVDKLYFDVESDVPYSEGPDYSFSPYLTLHMQVYDSNGSPDNLLYMYDYKNSITEVIQNDWYNFNIKVLDTTHGYLEKKDFAGSYFLVLSCSGSDTNNFVLWELVDNDEYMSSPSAVRF